MRLVKCHVENFGTLHDFTVEFENGLSVIKEDNGFGKTTTASFVKAMFYGMNKYQGKDLEKNDRARYKPWQGGNFGGNLDFIAGGKEYRIERFFGAKVTDDSFRLFDLEKGTESKDYTENIGTELFGIDSESFERSIFLPQQKLDSGMNASINAKLTGLVENSDDIGNFDNAMDELKKQNSARGVKGRLEKALKELLDTERQIQDRKSASDSLEALRQNASQLKGEITAAETELGSLRKRISAASNRAATLKDAERRKELLEEIKKAEQVLKELKLKYKNGLPKGKEIDDLRSAVAEHTATAKGMQMISDGSEEQARFDAVSAFFKNGVPENREIAVCREQSVKLGVLKVNLSAAESKLQAEEQKPNKAEGKSAVTVAFVVAVVLFLAGIGLLFVNTAIGIALLAVGIISVGAAGFLMLKGMIAAGNSANRNETVDNRKQYEQLKNEIAICESNITAFLSRFEGLTDVETVANKLNLYENAKQELEKATNIMAEKSKELEDLVAVINPFFLQYLGELPEDYTVAITAMREDARSFSQATETVENCSEKLKTIPEATVTEYDEDLSYDELNAAEKELASKLDGLKERLVTVEKQKDAAEQAAESVQQMSEQLEQQQAEADELKTALEVVKLTEAILVEAKDGLSGRYMMVLKESFKKYVNTVYGEDVGEFMLDNDLNLNLNREGKGRSKEVFSEGYRDMLDICMRLALIDSLYNGEKPMLILDDPFVNLDDNRVDNALSMLDELAKERQIIYLTCHSSRMPK